MTLDTHTMQMVNRYSDPLYTEPVLADEVFSRNVKEHLRSMYRKVKDVLSTVDKELETARKSGAHIGKLIRRKRAATALLAQIEKHGKRDVYLTPEDREMLFKHYTEEDFIKHFSFYLTKYE